MAKKKQSGKTSASSRKPSKTASQGKRKKAASNSAKPKARPVAAGAVKTTAARRLRRPAVLKGSRDNYLLVLTDAPDRVDGYELAQLVYDGNEGAGDITPPTGLGKSTFDQNLMDDTFGDVPIATCRKGLAELKGIIRDHVSALGYEKSGAVYEMSEADFLGAVEAARWKFVKFVHVEDE